MPRLYKRFSTESRVQITIAFLLKPATESKRSFCRDHEVSPRTLDGWLKKHKEQTLTIDKRKTNKRPQQINHESLKDAICAELINDGLTTVCRIRTKLYDEFPYSMSTYYKIVSELDYTFKRVETYTMPKNKSVEEELAKIAAKQIELRSYGIENVISIDECPFYEAMHPNYGWSKRGTPCVIRQNAIRTKCYSVLSAMSSDGRFIYKVVESGNRTTFLEFLKYNVMREFPNHKYLLMDNARIHHCPEVKEFIISKGKHPVYTVPYTPELNPIENGFSVLKQNVRQEKPKNKQELLRALRIAKKQLNGVSCSNMYKRAFGCTQHRIVR